MNRENIESIVPLSAMQQNFLWHSLKTDAESSVIQLRCKLTGTIDVDKLQLAWEHVVARHQALRSSVHWENVKRPLQVVHKQSKSEWFIPVASTEQDVHDFLREDGKRRIDLQNAPAFRAALFNVSDSACVFVWTVSHVLLDGWSCAVAVNDWIHIYTALLQGTTPPGNQSPPLHDYTRWIERQDRDKLLEFWDAYLPATDESEATTVPDRQALTSPERHTQSLQIRLPASTFTALQERLRQSGLALGTLLQATLATVIGKNGHDSVVFATTVSGRHAELQQIEQRVGMLMNLIPVCVEFDQHTTIRDWLINVQRRFFETLPYAHTGAADIQSIRPDQDSLFSTLLIVENQPAVSSTDCIEISDFQSGIISDVGTTLVAIPGDDLVLELRCQGRADVTQAMQSRLQRFVELLEALPSLLDSPLTVLAPYREKAVSEGRESERQPPSRERDKSPCVDVSPTFPQRALERKLSDIWCSVLKLSTIDEQADFFDLGGTSFQALIIFERIERELDIRLPATALFTAPTVSGLSDLIALQQPEALWSSVVEINHAGTGIPLFIPFEQADMLMYRNLCAELGPDQPVYGLNFASDSAHSEPFLNNLIASIKKLHPHGPYLLVGYSGAGIVAWKIAQKLRSQKEDVAMLCLLDTYGPTYPRLLPPVRRFGSVSLHLASSFASAAGISAGKTAESILKKIRLRSKSGSESAKPVSAGRPRYNDQYLSRLKKEHEQATRFINELARGKSRARLLSDHVVLAMTKWRYRSFHTRMAFITHVQGQLLKYCQEQQPESGTATELLPAMQQCRSAIDGSNPETVRMLDEYIRMYSDMQKYEGYVLYCKVAHRPPGIVHDPLVGWKALLSENTRVCTIAGNHNTMLQYPFVLTLSESLKQEIASVNRSNNRASPVSSG